MIPERWRWPATGFPKAESAADPRPSTGRDQVLLALEPWGAGNPPGGLLSTLISSAVYALGVIAPTEEQRWRAESGFEEFGLELADGTRGAVRGASDPRRSREPWKRALGAVRDSPGRVGLKRAAIWVFIKQGASRLNPTPDERSIGTSSLGG